MEWKALANKKIGNIDLEYTISVKKIPFTSNIERDSQVASLMIKYPENYPNTPIKEYEPDSLLRISSVFNTRLNKIHVSGFYNTAQTHKEYAYREEIDGLKGAGKDGLKFLLSFLVLNNYLNYNANITITAVADACKDSYILSQLMLLSDEEIISGYLSKHISDYNDYIKFNDRNYLRPLACRIITNYKLVNYYISLGFHIIDDSSGTGVKCGAIINEILNK